jgi:signal transduction histidine kinase
VSGLAATTRARLPWVAWVAGMSVLATALTLTAINGDEDVLFIVLAIAMVAGYTTVGAVLASRRAAGLLGWLMIAIGSAFAITGATGEYAFYAFETSTGSPPFGAAAALISEILWLPMLSAVGLVALLYPTGRVPTPRWRFLSWAIGALVVLFVAAEVLRPRTLDTDVDVVVRNPFGVETLEPLAEVAGGIGGIGLIAAAPLAIAALVLRFRRSRGEERQQIRWLAYIAATVAAVILLGIATNLIFGSGVLEGILFYITFILVGIGIPIAIGVAVLRYRLYDLDLVVKKTVLYAILAASFTLIAYAIVVGAPTIFVGLDEVPVVVLGPILAVAFLSIQRPARRLADRLVYGGRATPYEVLSEFSGRLGETYSTEDVLPRMAQLVGDATGASAAYIWLRVDARFRPVARWPGDAELPEPIEAPDDRLPDFGDAFAVEVRHQGELLGALTMAVPANDPMNPTKDRLVSDLSAQAGLVLRNVRLIEDLRASRQRLVAAQDDERRRIERNIHDGAQQQLVGLAVQLRLLEQQIERDPAAARAAASRLQAAATTALEDLRDLARGIYPPLLADRGLREALESQARKSLVPVDVTADGIGRYQREVESAVYFCVLEALQNVAKYANASRASVALSEANGDLTFEVVDDGAGFDLSAARGSGLINMRDRVEAVGGTLNVDSSPGHGTVVSGRLPARGADEVVPS